MGGARYVEVAVPVPLDETLTYAVPDALPVLPGCRVRVSVGKRRHVGVVMALRDQPPEGITIKPVLEVLDPAPVLTGELLELARFVAGYYLAPIGEVVRAMLPSEQTVQVRTGGRDAAELRDGVYVVEGNLFAEDDAVGGGTIST